MTLFFRWFDADSIAIVCRAQSDFVAISVYWERLPIVLTRRNMKPIWW